MAKKPSPQPSAGVPGEGAKAYVALGSNLGDRRANIESALRELSKSVRVIKTSSWLENAAVGGPSDSPAFLNAVAEIETTLPPRELLQTFLTIESTLGRKRREKWEPRLIDLDLILYGNSIIAEKDLHVPHPLMHERAFVLKPLLEIAPQAVHPIFNRTIAELANDIGIH